MGPVIVTWAPGTEALEASETMPLRWPRAAPWAWAASKIEKIMPNAKTELITSHLLFIALDLPSSRLIYKSLSFGLQMERQQIQGAHSLETPDILSQTLHKNCQIRR